LIFQAINHLFRSTELHFIEFFVIFCFKKHVFGHFWIFLGRNQKNVFSKPFAQFYHGHFKLSPRSLPWKMFKRRNFVRFRPKLDLPAPVTRTGGSKGKNLLVPLTSFVPVHLYTHIYTLLKNVIFWLKKYYFWLFWAICIFFFIKIFSVSFHLNFSDFLSYQPSL
jgi:hypothetical protein